LALDSLESARSFRDLLIWRKSHALVLSVYKLTVNFPRHETYAVTNQLQRAAVSVPANIAEGFKRRGKPDKARFLNMAQASLEECRYLLILVKDLGYADTEANLLQLDEASRLLARYTNQVLKSQ
jgi:four helix bundle protein